jgi:hypothetical protein
MTQARFRNPTTALVELPKALALCKKVYQKFGDKPATSEDLALALGYVNITGASGSILASLKQYGLLVSTSEHGQRASNAKFKLSDIALKAIEQDTPSREVAKNIILTPALYQELYNSFQESLPIEDITIVKKIIDEGFSEDKAQDLVRIVRKNWEFLQPLTEKVEPANKGIYYTTIENKLPTFKLLKDCEATVSFSSTITNEAIDKLIKHLELYKDVYPSISEIRRDY